MIKAIKGFVCVSIKDLVYLLENKICFSKQELAHIKSDVNQTFCEANKYKKVEQKLPELRGAIDKITLENQKLKQNNFYMLRKIGELYNADLNDDIKLKKSLFKELGFQKK
jgi:hypothetical protein